MHVHVKIDGIAKYTCSYVEKEMEREMGQSRKGRWLIKLARGREREKERAR